MWSDPFSHAYLERGLFSHLKGHTLSPNPSFHDSLLIFRIHFALMQLLSTVVCLWAAVSQCAVLRRFHLMSVCCTLDLTDQQRLSRERQIIRPQASTLLSLMRTCSREQSAMATGSTTSLARDWHHSTPARAHTRSFAMSKTTERKVSYLPRYPNVYLLL